jgi:putative addiction module killer protein
VIEVREYLSPDGTSPYAKWFNGLNAQAAAKVATAVTRMAQGNLSNAKSVGAGVQESRIDFGLAIESILVGMGDFAWRGD